MGQLIQFEREHPSPVRMWIMGSRDLLKSHGWTDQRIQYLLSRVNHEAVSIRLDSEGCVYIKYVHRVGCSELSLPPTTPGGGLYEWA